MSMSASEVEALQNPVRAFDLPSGEHVILEVRCTFDDGKRKAGTVFITAKVRSLSSFLASAYQFSVVRVLCGPE